MFATATNDMLSKYSDKSANDDAQYWREKNSSMQINIGTNRKNKQHNA